MKSGLFAVMRKELARFFGDKRMVASILLPGILIYFVYSFMGQAMGSMFGVDEDFAPAAQVVELPDSLAEPLQSAGLTLTEVEADQEEAAREAITGQELDLLLVFPADFDQAVADYAPASGQPAPQVAVYYNSSSTQSQFAYTVVTELLDTYEAQLANKFDVNAGAERYDLTTDEDAAGAYFAMLLPMLLMIFLYSGCAAVAPESIAGEKERGTIATMLITPIPRGHIAVGKILALAVIALLSGASSTIGTILALPKLMGAASDSLSADIYSVGDYLLLAAVILSTVLLLVTLISILSRLRQDRQGGPDLRHPPDDSGDAPGRHRHVRRRGQPGPSRLPDPPVQQCSVHGGRLLLHHLYRRRGRNPGGQRPVHHPGRGGPGPDVQQREDHFHKVGAAVYILFLVRP